MSAAPPESAPPARDPGALAFGLGLLTLVVLGLGLGMFGPWGQRRHTPDSAPLLIERLGARETRHTAMLQLLDLGPARAGPALLAALHDPAFSARAEAIELLGRLRYQEALPILLALEAPDLQGVRLSALGAMGGPEALAVLRGALHGPREELRFVALRELSEWRDPLPREARDEVLPFLAAESFGLREFAALCCGRQRDAQAVTPLIGRLADDHGDVRKAAAWALSQIGDPAGVAAVQSAYASGAIAEDP